MGTNCTDNGTTARAAPRAARRSIAACRCRRPRQSLWVSRCRRRIGCRRFRFRFLSRPQTGFKKFISVASKDPATVQGYECAPGCSPRLALHPLALPAGSACSPLPYPAGPALPPFHGVGSCRTIRCTSSTPTAPTRRSAPPATHAAAPSSALPRRPAAAFRNPLRAFYRSSRTSASRRRSSRTSSLLPATAASTVRRAWIRSPSPPLRSLSCGCRVCGLLLTRGADARPAARPLRRCEQPRGSHRRACYLPAENSPAHAVPCCCAPNAHPHASHASRPPFTEGLHGGPLRGRRHDRPPPVRHRPQRPRLGAPGLGPTPPRDEPRGERRRPPPVRARDGAERRPRHARRRAQVRPAHPRALAPGPQPPQRLCSGAADAGRLTPSSSRRRRRTPRRQPAPLLVGKILAWLLEKIGPKARRRHFPVPLPAASAQAFTSPPLPIPNPPATIELRGITPARSVSPQPLQVAPHRAPPQGLEFAKYSLDYHTVRNFIYVQRAFPPEQAARHVPGYARRIVEQYDKARWALVEAAAASGEVLPVPPPRSLRGGGLWRAQPPSPLLRAAPAPPLRRPCAGRGDHGAHQDGQEEVRRGGQQSDADDQHAAPAACRHRRCWPAAGPPTARRGARKEAEARRRRRRARGEA